MRRRQLAERMDQPDQDPHLLAEDLRNLEVLNRLFGGRGAVLRRARPLLARVPPGTTLHVLDLASGAGDLCRTLVDECRRRKVAVRLCSLDVHPQIQAYARTRGGKGYPEIRYVRGDARRLPFPDRTFDLVTCTLALHHFAEADAARVLAEMRRVTRRWAVVSDLSRSPQAYAGVWFATRFMANPITRFDGPVSVLRAYTGSELRSMAAAAGWSPARFHAEPWFRMSMVYEEASGW